MTTRTPRARGGPRVGQTAHLYWKMRQPAKDKPIHLIGRSPIINVKRYDNMRRLLLSLGVKGALEYIKAEGFDGLGELVQWWTGEKPSSYGIMNGGIFLDTESWVRLAESGPVEVIQWMYPLRETGHEPLQL